MQKRSTSMREQHGAHERQFTFGATLWAVELDASKEFDRFFVFTGTGVGSRAVAELSLAGRPPLALILESPFNNLPSVIEHHPFSFFFRRLPWFEATIISPLMRSGLVFSSDVHIAK